MKPPPLIVQAHQRLKQHIQPGDLLIDATAGNGHDTLFLAQQTGPTGHVFAFDLQQKAIEKTQARLEKYKVQQQCSLIHASHENMIENIPSKYHRKINAITFNLGYLPGAEKETTTQAPSTIAALNQSLELLAPNGLISLLIYKGHPAGKSESIAIEQWLDEHPELECKIHQSVDPDKNTPELKIILTSPS